MKLPVESKVSISFAAGVVLVLVVAFVAFRTVATLVDRANRVTHTEEVLEQLEVVLSLMNDVETGTRGYLLTGSQRDLEPYQSALEKVNREIKALRKLTADNPTQLRQIDSLEPLIESKLAYSRKLIALRNRKDFETARQLFLSGKGKQIMDQIRSTIRRVDDEQNPLSYLRTERVEESTHFASMIILVGCILSVVIAGLAFVIINRDVNHMRQAEAEKSSLVHQLQEALRNIKTLSGLLPICSHCKKIRDDKGYWHAVETYVISHTEAEFSHGICPDCLERFFGSRPGMTMPKGSGF